MASSTIDKTSRIAIVGAGPAGLSTAWFLSKRGYHNVTVLEKLGRVGGLCKSLTVDGMSFDLGANYVTWGYQETLAIAKEVGGRRGEAVHVDRRGARPKELQVSILVRRSSQ